MNWNIRTSLQARINATLLGVVSLILLSTVAFTHHSETALIEEIVTEHTEEISSFYFDSINTLMLTGGMANREIVRQKVLSREGIKEARIIRGDAVNKMFPGGFGHEQAKDALDQQALKGEALSQITESENGRLLTVLTPLIASKDFRGTDCLSCHQVPEGEVLGAVRISYSLQALDQQIGSNIQTSIGIQIALYLLGGIVLVSILKRFVIGPILNLKNAIEIIERDADVSQRVDENQQDELGRLAKSFNKMLTRLQNSLSQIKLSSEEMEKASAEILAFSDRTTQNAEEQCLDTDDVISAITELEATSHSTFENAKNTAEMSKDSDMETKKTMQSSKQARENIGSLLSEVDSVSTAVKELNEQTEEVSKVLDVISGISDQTNLLALNAAIEAARAGEAGRGFAVVADEVRALAQRTNDSTEEIKSIIEALRSKAQNAVHAMDQAHSSAESGNEQLQETSEALTLIAGKMDHITKLNQSIANASNEQNAATTHIHDAVSSILKKSDSTKHNANKTTATVNRLVEQTRQLNLLLSEFKL
jgi:methyl-accepting chemotaxis protein